MYEVCWVLTDTYQGVPISILGSGMGIPSASIYVTDLITDLFYTPDTEMFDVMEKCNILGVEMETARIYAAAVVSTNAGESTSNS